MYIYINIYICTHMPSHSHISHEPSQRLLAGVFPTSPVLPLAASTPLERYKRPANGHTTSIPG